MFEDKLKVSIDNRPASNQRETFHLLAEIKNLIHNQTSQNKMRNTKSEPIVVVDSGSELDPNDQQIVTRYYGNDQLSGFDLILQHLFDEKSGQSQVELGLVNAFNNKKSPFWMVTWAF